MKKKTKKIIRKKKKVQTNKNILNCQCSKLPIKDSSVNDNNSKDINTISNIIQRDKTQSWKNRICVAVPTTGLVRIEWVLARFGQVMPCNWSNSDVFQFFNQCSPIGWAVADARNICVKYFIEGGAEWLLFLDHDTCPPPDLFIKMNQYMLEGKVPIVSGLYYCKGTYPEPLLYRGKGNGYYADWKRGDKVWVDGIPMGCTLIHGSIIRTLYENSPEYVCKTLSGNIVVREVFKTPNECFQDPETNLYQTKIGTEDLYFCNRVIEEKIFSKCGVDAFKEYEEKKYPFLVDTSIFCKHIDEKGTMYP